MDQILIDSEAFSWLDFIVGMVALYALAWLLNRFFFSEEDKRPGLSDEGW